MLIDGQLVFGRIGAHLLFLFVVHVADVIHVNAFRRPFLIHRFGDRLERLLPAAVVAHEQDVREARADRAQRDVTGNGGEGFLRYVHAARKPHVAGLLHGIARRRKRHRRIHERISEPLGDPLGDVVREEEVLAERQAGAVLFDAAGIVNCSGLAAGNRVAHFGPRQVFDQDRSILRAGHGGPCEDRDRDAGDNLSHKPSEGV